MSKITMTTPIVEMDGDEMTRILWQLNMDEDMDGDENSDIVV